MPIAAILTTALTLFCIVHLFRTGRPMMWLFVILMVPVVGPLAYLFVEVLSGFGQNPAARKAWSRARKAIDPNRGVREGSL
ncbi:MAG TPA: PLDc N-terminal domain-containing protein, partial [Gammaproteobacteria bacterium]|nr:PLDc N-terminal domain-containing protein [Gammaproteobacteria bacterium]